MPGLDGLEGKMGIMGPKGERLIEIVDSSICFTALMDSYHVHYYR
jgi:hypothetical protein